MKYSLGVGLSPREQLSHQGQLPEAKGHPFVLGPTTFFINLQLPAGHSLLENSLQLFTPTTWEQHRIILRRVSQNVATDPC